MMMTEGNLSNYVSIFATICLVSTVLTAGCFEGIIPQNVTTEDVKTGALNAASGFVVIKGSAQYCVQYPDAPDCPKPVTPNVSVTYIPEVPTRIVPSTPTTAPTVTVAATPAFHFVDPTSAGERWVGQWFKWTWLNASGLQDANRGILVYGHSYHNTLTQWNDAWGNYDVITPPDGMRFLAVYVHEEDFGPDDAGLWGYGPQYFYLQYANTLHTNFTGYNKVYRIIDLEQSTPNYYRDSYIGPFAAHRIYMGAQAAKSGGYIIEEYYDLRTGKGNAWDGYILYTVPVTVTDNDIRIVGKFAGKSVNWRFDENNYQFPTN